MYAFEYIWTDEISLRPKKKYIYSYCTVGGGGYSVLSLKVRQGAFTADDHRPATVEVSFERRKNRTIFFIWRARRERAVRMLFKKETDDLIQWILRIGEGRSEGRTIETHNNNNIIILRFHDARAWIH